MSFEWKNILTKGWFLSFLYWFICLYSLTFRVTVKDEKVWLDYLRQGGKVLLCSWHQQFFITIRHFRKYKEFHPSLMISKSRDGEIIAGVARRCGWHAVRGSSSRGGTDALRAMMELFQESRLAGHVVDGPQGPAGKVKAGVIRLSHAAAVVIVPVYTVSERAWYFNSWDNFFIPKPFSSVNITFGPMIKFNPTDNQDEFENQRLQLENIMTPGLQGKLA